MAKVRKTVLILGGTGIIGNHLSIAASNKQMKVYCVSRSLKSNLDPRVQQIIGDVYDKESFSNKIKDLHFDAVIDLLSFNASQLSVSLDMFNGRCSQYIFVSSATIFRSGEKSTKITEVNARVNDGWGYPLNKIKCEAILRAYSDSTNQSYTIVRPYITYSDQRISFGAWEGYGILERIIQGRPIVIGDELAQVKTTLTHSYDLAQGIVGLIANPKAVNEDFNITSDESITWREVFEAAADIVGSTLNIESVQVDLLQTFFPEIRGKISDRMMVRVFDNNKLKEAYNDFSCKYTIREGYSEVIKSFMENDSRTVDYVTQGRIDNLIFTSTRSLDTRQEIINYRKLLRGRSFRDYLKYSVGYHPPIYVIAKAIKRILNFSSVNHYSI